MRRQASPNFLRDRLATLMALGTVACLGLAFLFANTSQFLSPGPLTSAHGAIEACNACHTSSGTGNLSWIHGLLAGDPEADSNACLGCHKMPDTAFNPHGASIEVLKQSTKRLTKVAAETPAPHWTSAQSVAFPTHDMVERGLYCSTCHQEHKGASSSLTKISNEKCQSCHVVKFDSFDGHHPGFENYPFKQRSPIIYDHAAHGKRFADLAKKEPTKRIPATCSHCHSDRIDRRVMAVNPFEQTCSSCHLGQITGKERVSGPKGIAFLTVPGLDLQTLRKKNAPIGDWPTDSEAELTPFMKVMISRKERGRYLIKTVESLNLQDLSDASDEQIKAVTDLVWEIKGLFYALISGKASDVLGDLNVGCGAKLSPNLVADLTASIPRDVVISAQQQWLPNLGAEMANRPNTSDQEQGCWIETTGGWVTSIAESGLAVQQTKSKTATDAAPKSLRIDPYGGLVKGREDEAEGASTKQAPPQQAPAKEAPVQEALSKEAPTKAAASTDTASTKPGKVPSVDERPQAKAADQNDDLLYPTEEELRGLNGGGVVKGYIAYATPDGSKEMPFADETPRAIKTAGKDGVQVAQADGAVRKPAADAAPRAGDQTDDLLNPTEEELRGLPPALKEADKIAQPDGAVGQVDTARPKAGSDVPVDASKAGEKAAPPKDVPGKADSPKGKVDSASPADAAPKAQAKASAPTGSDTATAAPQAKVAPIISIQSDVDAESWAEYGGWYRQDYTIFYRPTGHKDKFIYSWLFLTGPQAPKGDTSPAAAVFELLSGKDTQGACTKCHSVDDIVGKGRMVNFSLPSVATKQGRFTRFVHEPHLSILEHRGCLTCHNLTKDPSYLQTYQQGNPKAFTPNFSSVKKELCESCHTSGMARQDCLLCHKYHVHGATRPTMTTTIPAE
jgi:hypothetical protein